MDRYALLTALTYAVALVLALFAGSVVAFLLWAERSRPSVIALGAGGTVVACMSLTATLIQPLLS
jgi:hypothetical protein